MSRHSKGGKRLCPECCNELHLWSGFAEMDSWYECREAVGGCKAKFFADDDVIFVKKAPKRCLIVSDGECG